MSILDSQAPHHAQAEPGLANDPPSHRLQALFQAQRTAFERDSLPSLKVRRDRLDRLMQMTRQHAQGICDAISKDFGQRAWQETFMAELMVFEQRLNYTRRHLPRWMRMRRVGTQLQYGLARNRLLPQPLGVVGILSPWNYPFDLSLSPAIDALAAGNRVMIKPSELNPHFGPYLAEMVAQFFDPSELTVVLGDVPLAAAFSRLPFDHLLFTGSTAVGRVVAAAAAANLTPVTLELGGKSPVIIDDDCDLPAAAQRIAWGKLLNAGQTCIAPDYVLVADAQVEPLVQAILSAMQNQYPSLAQNPDYTSIISPRHWQRLQDMLADAQAQGAQLHVHHPAGEVFDPAARKMAPVIITGVRPSMRIAQEEIFGPILPIMACGDLDQVLAHVRQRDRPLALYWFGRNTQRRDRVLRETISGGVSINDCLLHVSQLSQPFGGVGPSGQGAHHGQWGFESCSKLKPIFIQSRWHGMGLVSAPYGRLINWAFRFFTR
jgi:coniferyl-aldehyde dehydrogenase